MSTPNDLPAYRVIYADGTSYVTSMAKNVTLGKARAYLVNASIEQPDGSCKRVADVQPYEPTQPSPAAVEQALAEEKANQEQISATVQAARASTVDWQALAISRYERVQELLQERDALQAQRDELLQKGLKLTCDFARVSTGRDDLLVALRHCVQTLDAIYSGELNAKEMQDVAANELPEARAAIARATEGGAGQ